MKESKEGKFMKEEGSKGAARGGKGSDWGCLT